MFNDLILNYIQSINGLIDNYIITFIILSIIINLLLTPLNRYSQSKYNDFIKIKEKINSKVKHIKSYFKGEEQLYMLNTLYRQNKYSHFSQFLVLLPLIIQIIFLNLLINFVENNSIFTNLSIWIIKDVSKPDYYFGTLSILPFIMFVINLIINYLFSKETKMSFFQFYILPILLFLFAFVMPSLIVIYWIANNIISLIQLLKLNYKYKQNVYKTSYYFVATVSILTLLGVNLSEFQLLSIFIVSILSSSYVINRFKSNITDVLPLFILLNIFLLIFFYIPSEFLSEKEIIRFGSNVLYIFFIQGIFFSYILYRMINFIYMKLDINNRNKFTHFFSIIFFLIILNYFIIPSNAGLLDLFIFKDTEFMDNISTLNYFINISLNLLTIILSIYVMNKYPQKIYRGVLNIFAISILILLSINIWNFNKNLLTMKSNIKKNKNEKIYTFSTNKENILILLLDRGFSGFVPDIFKEKEIYDSFSGFTWYPNTLSESAGHTLSSFPIIFGGNNYNIENLKEKTEDTLKFRRDQAYKIYSNNFLKKGYDVQITRPSFLGGSHNGECHLLPKGTNCNIPTVFFDKEIDLLKFLKVYAQLYTISIFNITPNIFKKYIYDNGDWLGNKIPNRILFGYTQNLKNLKMLRSQSIAKKTRNNQFIFIANNLPHNPSYVDINCNKINAKNISKYNDELTDIHYGPNKCAIKTIAIFFNWLKKEKVYNNTKIIVLSDHGWYFLNPLTKKLINERDNKKLSLHQPILFIKERNETSKIKTSYDFKTLGVVYPIICKEIGSCFDKYTNTYSSIPKVGNELIGYDVGWSLSRNNKYSYKVTKTKKLKHLFTIKNLKPL